MRMVNNRFPEKAPYGFELVDSWFAAAHLGINRKFTSNQIDGNSCKAFCDLTPTQALAIYRQLVVCLWF
jgi:hypothetical protein